eukprot:CAMPEP_0202729626 /NCGR_PEP_ID=MMETSP1385-20130828/186227_1 /ASSEMBLY_ACC=CAM_ASM_000861 /TAXON_ID=933848 /ORGANISM="Elphidium margaritaceum" /LENGTH=458 /DNA_ID=CAMNT_0049395893 /DNA_START=42 /DNA_END=1418 /DNA_ORIENTATION=+
MELQLEHDDSRSRELSSSDDIEICYMKQLSSRCNTACTMDIDIELASNSSSSVLDEDEDSKMMELPEMPMLPTTESTPYYHNQMPVNMYPQYSPVLYARSLSTTIIKQHAHAPTAHYEVVDDVDECLQSQEKRECMLPTINCSRSHYWRRFGASFAAVLLVCSIPAVWLNMLHPHHSLVNVSKYVSLLLIALPWLIFAVMFVRICVKYHAFNSTLSRSSDIDCSIALLPYYQNERVRDQVLHELNEDHHFQFTMDKHMVRAFDIGYAGFAALNTVLASIYDQGFYIKFPAKPADVSLPQLHQLIQNQIIDDLNVDIVRFPKIKLENVQYISQRELSLQQFMSLMQRTSVQHEAHNQYVRTYFIAAFNKQALLHGDNTGTLFDYFERIKQWVTLSNYLSPIIGHVIDEQQNMHVLVLDVCENDAPYYFVPVERMYDAIQCEDYTGNAGGLLRIEAHLIS